jgi:hypothetical protein
MAGQDPGLAYLAAWMARGAEITAAQYELHRLHLLRQEGVTPRAAHRPTGRSYEETDNGKA